MINFIVFIDRRGDIFSSKVLKALENIDDDCDKKGIIFVKVIFFIRTQESTCDYKIIIKIFNIKCFLNNKLTGHT